MIEITQNCRWINSLIMIDVMKYVNQITKCTKFKKKEKGIILFFRVFLQSNNSFQLIDDISEG